MAALAVIVPAMVEWQHDHIAAARAAEKPHWVVNCDGSNRLVRPLPPPAPLPGWTHLIIIGAFGLVGVTVELGVRKQLDLARNGLEAEATIDEVEHVRRGRSDYYLARWSFIAADQKLYHGKCTINEYDAMALHMGTRVPVYYDIVNPKRNRIEHALRAVQWDQPATA